MEYSQVISGLRQLTDGPALTCQSSKIPRHRSQAQTAVRCSDLVRRRAVHTQKSPVKSVPTRREARPRYGARNDNREPRQTHEKKIRAPLESTHKTLCGLCASVVKNNHGVTESTKTQTYRTPPNVQAHRP